MAVLSGGQTWGLSAARGDPQQPQQHVVLVKLTDAAIKAINQHNKNAKNSLAPGSKPSIRFPAGSESGLISIPVPGSDGSQHLSEFHFSISSTDADVQGPQSSFECLATTNGGGGDHRSGMMKSIGQFQEKLQIKGSSDTFVKFGEKMEEAKKESEKRTTQFLDNGPSSKSKTVQRRPMKQTFSRNGKIGASGAGAGTSSGSGGGGGSTGAIRGSGMMVANAVGSDTLERPNLTHPHTAIGPSGDNGQLSTHPYLDRGGSGTSSNSFHKQQPNPQLVKRPLRERIIHLLAVRPFKKPELLSRIIGEGVRNVDKNNIMQVLKQVSNVKDNTYQLHRHIWNDVSEDWPFYTEQERHAFRRRKPQNLTPPFSDGSTSSSGQSPSSTHHSSPLSGHHHGGMGPLHGQGSGGLKRPPGGASDMEAALSAKRKRVSNYVRPPDMRMEPRRDEPVAVSPGRLLGIRSPPVPTTLRNSSPKSQLSQARSRSRHGSSPQAARSPLASGHRQPPPPPPPSKESTLSPSAKRQQIPLGIATSPLQPPAASSSPGGSRNSSFLRNSPAFHRRFSPHSGSPPNTSSPLPVLPHNAPSEGLPPQGEDDFELDRDYENEFVTIRDQEQRVRYKTVFTENYDEYRALHDKLQRTALKFESLKRDLMKEKPGSAQYESLKSTIVQEYQKQHHQRFKDSQRQFQYLHQKLKFIKSLVTEYDDRMVERARREMQASRSNALRRAEVRS